MKFCGSHNGKNWLDFIIFKNDNHANFYLSYCVSVSFHSVSYIIQKKYVVDFLEKNLLCPLKISSTLISNSICRLHVIKCLSVGLAIPRFLDSYS